MAIISIPSADVRTPVAANIFLVTGGEAIAAGKWVRLNTVTKKYMIANKSSADDSAVTYLAITTCAGDNSTFVVLAGPSIELANALFTQGTTYYLATNGDLMLESDLVATDWITRLGTAESTTKLVVDIDVLAFQKA